MDDDNNYLIYLNPVGIKNIFFKGELAESSKQKQIQLHMKTMNKDKGFKLNSEV